MHRTRLLIILLLNLSLVVCMAAKLGGKDSRSELEYRVEKLEKQNAQLRGQLDELNTKLKMIQSRLDACPGQQAGQALAPGTAKQAAIVPVNVPEHLKIIRIPADSENDIAEKNTSAPLKPEVRHFFSETPQAPAPAKADPVAQVEQHIAPSGKAKVIVVESDEDAIKAFRSKNLKDGEGRLIVVRNGEPATVVATKAAQPAKVKVSDSAGKDDDSIFEMYQEALKLFNDKQYKDAIAGFEKFIEAYPGSTYLDNAYYWLGECYLEQQDHDKAESAFRKVIDDYQHGTKAADALYKIGISELQQSELDKGLDTLEEVRLLYPYSDAAKLAEEKIKEVSD